MRIFSSWPTESVIQAVMPGSSTVSSRGSAVCGWADSVDTEQMEEAIAKANRVSQMNLRFARMMFFKPPQHTMRQPRGTWLIARCRIVRIGISWCRLAILP
jgi:hypothetical protein